MVEFPAAFGVNECQGRGPVIAGAVKQFWTDVIWEDVDYMFVDMPLGTGDVPLTVLQSLPVDGIVIVTSPQDLVLARLPIDPKVAEYYDSGRMEDVDTSKMAKVLEAVEKA